jgi:hypothetical protein
MVHAEAARENLAAQSPANMPDGELEVVTVLSIDDVLASGEPAFLDI